MVLHVLSNSDQIARLCTLQESIQIEGTHVQCHIAAVYEDHTAAAFVVPNKPVQVQSLASPD